MRRIIFYMTIIQFGAISPIISADKITKVANMYRHGDKLVKQQVEYKEPDCAGKQIVWDFSQLNIVNEEYNIHYYTMENRLPENITGLEHGTCYNYILKNDTLWMCGYNNRTTKMTLEKPEAVLKYPFSYGDTLKSHFSGKGSYANKQKLKVIGESFITVDGIGVLITPENDTLKNIIRTYKIREYNEIGISDASIKLETYSWYAQGYRYPVFETVKSQGIMSDSVVDQFKTSFYYPISKMEMLEDTANVRLRELENGINKVLIKCSTYPNPVRNEVYIDFQLSENASVSLNVSDISGRLIKTISNENYTAGNHSIVLEMSDFIQGEYALHIIVNGNVHQIKLIKI